MSSNCIQTVLLLFACSIGIVFVTIGGIIIREHIVFDKYVKTQCTDFSNSDISSTFGHYKCEGYAKSNNGTEIVKLHYPTLNYLFFDTSESDCAKWIKDLENSVFDCYVRSGDGYTKAEQIIPWLIMFVVGMAMIIIVIVTMVTITTAKAAKRYEYEDIDEL